MTKKIPVEIDNDSHWVSAVVEVFYRNEIDRTDTDRGVKVDKFAVPDHCEIICVVDEETRNVMNNIPQTLQIAIKKEAMKEAEKNSYNLAD